MAPGTHWLVWANHRSTHHRSSPPGVALDQATLREVGVWTPTLALVSINHGVGETSLAEGLD